MKYLIILLLFPVFAGAQITLPKGADSDGRIVTVYNTRNIDTSQFNIICSKSVEGIHKGCIHDYISVLKFGFPPGATVCAVDHGGAPCPGFGTDNTPILQKMIEEAPEGDWLEIAGSTKCNHFWVKRYAKPCKGICIEPLELYCVKCQTEVIQYTYW